MIAWQVPLEDTWINPDDTHMTVFNPDIIYADRICTGISYEQETLADDPFKRERK